MKLMEGGLNKEWMVEKLTAMAVPRGAREPSNRAEVEKPRRPGVMMKNPCSGSALRDVTWFWNYRYQNQGGMCYRQILAKLRSGP